MKGSFIILDKSVDRYVAKGTTRETHLLTLQDAERTPGGMLHIMPDYEMTEVEREAFRSEMVGQTIVVYVTDIVQNNWNARVRFKGRIEQLPKVASAKV